MKTIHTKLFILFLLVTMGTLIPTLVTIRQSLSNSWQQNVALELRQKSNLIKTLLNVERLSLQKLVLLISEEPMLKMSVQLGDPVTIRDTLAQLQSMLHADLIIITDAEGKPTAEILKQSPKTRSRQKSQPYSVIKNSIEEGDLGADLILLADNLYLVACHAISFDSNIGGSVLVGKALENRFAKFLAEQSGSPVSLLAENKVVASSWENMKHELSEFMHLSNEKWQGSSFDFVMPGMTMQLFLQSSLTRLEQRIVKLEKQLIILGFVVLIFAGVLSYLFSAQLSGPIAKLKEAAGEVASGNFDTAVTIDSGDELGELGKSFDTMRSSLIRQREELIRSESLRKDLELASKIQKSLLPRKLPKIRNDIQIACKLIPSNLIGGDYYGFLENQNTEQFGCVIADVAGHGTASAILMAMARSVIQAEAKRVNDPAKLLRKVNEILFPDLEEAQSFISMFCFYYDDSKGLLKFANAGHNLPLLHRKATSRFESLDADGMLIGILEDCDYELREIPIKKGDFLVMYTDGLIEPHDLQNQQFSLERLKSVLTRDSKLSASDLVANLYDEVDKFAGEAAFSDDRTCVLIHW